MKLNKVFAALILCSTCVLTACQPNSNSSKNPATQEQINSQSFENISLNTENMLGYLKDFQAIADHHQGNRAVGSSGGQASADYILKQLKKSGYQVEKIPFENRDKVTGHNIVVDIPGQDQDSIVMLGAHYDSVKMGPGINDNASGTVLLLDLIDQIAQHKLTPKQSIRIAFWDSEEAGIGGSQAYVNGLNDAQLKQIKAYINIDMVGTKDGEVLIADADRSTIVELEKTLKQSEMRAEEYQPILDALRAIPAHAGDIVLEQQLKDFLGSKKVKFKEDLSILTATDALPFLGKVPVASLTLFNEQMKGDVLEFAPCYHQACDTIEQVDPQSLGLVGEAVLDLLKKLA